MSAKHRHLMKVLGAAPIVPPTYARVHKTRLPQANASLVLESPLWRPIQFIITKKGERPRTYGRMFHQETIMNFELKRCES